MIFVDYLGPAGEFARVREAAAREIADALRVGAGEVTVRRIVTDPEGTQIELWVELSSDEQLYRLGHTIAQRVAGAIRDQQDQWDVWVMFRVVPRSHAFLNGVPRRRASASFE